MRHGLPYFVEAERQIVQRGLRPGTAAPAARCRRCSSVPSSASRWGSGPATWPAGSRRRLFAAAVVAGDLRRAPRCGCGSSPAGRSGAPSAASACSSRSSPVRCRCCCCSSRSCSSTPRSGWWRTRWSPGVLAMAVMFFAAIAVVFLLVRLPEEMDRRRRRPDVGRLVERLPRDAPSRTARPRSFDEIPEEDLRGVLEVTGLQKWNLVWCCWSHSSSRCCCCRSPCWCSSWSSARSSCSRASSHRGWTDKRHRTVTAGRWSRCRCSWRLLGALLHGVRRDRRDVPPAVLHRHHTRARASPCAPGRRTACCCAADRGPGSEMVDQLC